MLRRPMVDAWIGAGLVWTSRVPSEAAQALILTESSNDVGATWTVEPSYSEPGCLGALCPIGWSRMPAASSSSETLV